MRIIVAVKTNRGGTWIVPIVESLIRHGDDVLCIVADEDGHLERSLTDVGASTMRSAALGGSGPISAALAFPRLVRQVRRFDPAVINYHLYRTALVFRVVSLFVPKARRVHSVPGPLFLEQRLVRWIERVVARRDSLIICTSGATRCLYRQVGYPDARMATIAYPIDLGAWDVITPEDRLEARKDLGIEIGTFVAVMVAYFYAPRRWVLGGRSVKGHEVALEGWAEFRRRGGEGTLLLVGGGFGETGDAYRRALLDKAGARSDASIRIVETVSNVRPYYAAADVSVAPSRSENLGSAAEASALGVPTIASNVGGLPELVRPGQTGWLVEPEDWRGLAAAFGHCSAMRNEPVMDEMRRATRRAVDDVASASHVLPLWRSAIRGDDDSSHG